MVFIYSPTLLFPGYELLFVHFGELGIAGGFSLVLQRSDSLLDLDLLVLLGGLDQVGGELLLVLQVQGDVVQESSELLLLGEVLDFLHKTEQVGLHVLVELGGKAHVVEREEELNGF